MYRIDRIKYIQTLLMLIIVWLTCAAELSGQSLEEQALQRIRASYAKLQSCSLVVESHLYAREVDRVPQRTIFSEAKYSPQGSFVRNDSVVTITNANGVLVIDKKEKFMHYRNAPANTAQQSLEMQKKAMQAGDSLFKAIYKTSLSMLGDSILRLEAIPKRAGSGPVRKVYEFRTATGVLAKITDYYGAGSIYRKVDVVYKYADLAPFFSGNEFSESDYLDGTGPNAKPLPKYAHYKFSNTHSKTLNPNLNYEGK